jgi:DNA polymerase I
MVTAWDTETHLIEPGLLAPPLVCLQWDSGYGPNLLHRQHARPQVESMLRGRDVLVGHNVAFDFGIVAAQWPDLIPAIFAKYDRNEVTDTMLREQLVMISRGTFRSQMGNDGELYPVTYHLADCVQRHFGRRLKKDGHRMFYRAFTDTPDIAHWNARAFEFQEQCRRGEWPEWTSLCSEADKKGLLEAGPEEAAGYALEDARVTLQLYQSQRDCFDSSVFVDEYRQARAAFALHLCSTWGIYTDPPAVDKLEGELTREFETIRTDLQEAGLIRDDGTADTAAARDAMVRACEEDGVALVRTRGGAVSLSAEACDRFEDESIIGQYSRYLTVRKTLSNDIKMLRAGCENPIQPRYGMAESGRTRASKPNIQAINRGAGIREAFRPRPGKVFAQADFEGLELHTLAQWCVTVIGWSELAKALNARTDVHTLTAANMLGIPYETALARKKAGDAEIKEYRQRAKAVNFGLPGGLGAKKLARYAKVNYGVAMTIDEATAAKAMWLRLYPEMNEFFRLAAVATNNPARLGDETHIFSGRIARNMRYSKLCNGRFQGLGADAAKEALWRVARACYADSSSVMYGDRPVAFIHDEIICETDADDTAHDSAMELGRLMCEGANVFLPDVPARVEPQLMRVWSKKAEPVYDARGRLIPWDLPNLEA